MFGLFKKRAPTGRDLGDVIADGLDRGDWERSEPYGEAQHKKLGWTLSGKYWVGTFPLIFSECELSPSECAKVRRALFRSDDRLTDKARRETLAKLEKR